MSIINIRTYKGSVGYSYIGPRRPRPATRVAVSPAAVPAAERAPETCAAAPGGVYSKVSKDFTDFYLSDSSASPTFPGAL